MTKCKFIVKLYVEIISLMPLAKDEMPNFAAIY